jgi:hypothetical protein
VTYPYHRAFDAQYNDKIDQHFIDHAMGLYLAPGSIRSGFVFTNLHLGTKSFNVDLVGADNQPHTFTFFIPVPGLRSDHQDVDFDNLYAKNEISSYNEAEFKQALRDLPCCTTNPDGTLLGGPINLVIVANGEDLLRVLIRSGWDETASALDAASSQPAISSQVPQSYRYRPVEPLYYYGRSQDASFRESRAAGFQSNKLRLWLSPMLYEGKEVWVGQINRDHVKRSSGKHDKKLDLDEVRDFLIQNLWYSQGVDKLGYVEGKDAVSPISQPKKTYRGVTYLTDGYRAVIWLSSDAVPLSDVKAVNWDQPPLKVDILKIDD